MKRTTFIFTILWLAVFRMNAFAGLSQEQLELEQYVDRLDKVNYLPTLLPIIIENSDVIGLTDEQVGKLLEWRKNNRQDVIAAMNEIVRKRSEIRQAALSLNVSSARIEQMQSEIFRLQRKVLDYKLSCRDTVIKTFNQQNWESFLFVLADEGIDVELPTMMATK
ncbi:MAG: hypothetical protein LJE83_12195 [Gammaproteobacteria bacterium]|nr:hypothetical protein [Gammaproteobacteria bacterium]